MKAYQFTVEDLPQGGYAVKAREPGQEILSRLCITSPDYHLALKVAWQMNQLVAALAKRLRSPLEGVEEPQAPEGPEGGEMAPLVPPSPLLPPSDATTPAEATVVKFTNAQAWGAAAKPTNKCPW